MLCTLFRENVILTEVIFFPYTEETFQLHYLESLWDLYIMFVEEHDIKLY